MTNLLYKIDKQYPDFTKSEKKIADFILNAPHKIIDMSVQDLACTIDAVLVSIANAKSWTDISIILCGAFKIKSAIFFSLFVKSGYCLSIL